MWRHYFLLFSNPERAAFKPRFKDGKKLLFERPIQGASPGRGTSKFKTPVMHSAICQLGKAIQSNTSRGETVNVFWLKFIIS